MLKYRTSTGDLIFINPHSIAAVQMSEDISTYSYIFTSGGCWLVQRDCQDVIADLRNYFNTVSNAD